MLKVIIGAGNVTQEGFISTQENELNLLNEESFKRMFKEESVDCFLLEHVLEHLSFIEGLQATERLYRYLKKGGIARIAVPDKNFRNEWYQNMCKPKGPGPKDHPAYSHKVFYDYKKLTEILMEAGFEVNLLEWCDENGDFHYSKYDEQYGIIGRSLKHDTRNKDGQLTMVSLIIDAKKNN